MSKHLRAAEKADKKIGIFVVVAPAGLVLSGWGAGSCGDHIRLEEQFGNDYCEANPHLLAVVEADKTQPTPAPPVKKSGVPKSELSLIIDTKKSGKDK